MATEMKIVKMASLLQLSFNCVFLIIPMINNTTPAKNKKMLDV